MLNTPTEALADRLAQLLAEQNQLLEALLGTRALSQGRPRLRVNQGAAGAQARATVLTIPFRTEYLDVFNFTVQTAVDRYLVKRPERISVLLFNTGVGNIRWHTRRFVNPNEGALLPGAASLNIDGYTGEIWAVAAAPTGLTVLELVE